MIAVANLIRYEPKQIENLESAYLPHISIISLIQDGIYCKPEVEKGDYVQEGKIIAKNLSQNSYIHSSIPGRVIAFQKECMPNGKKEDAILIALEGEFRYLGKKIEKIQWLNIPSSQRVKSLYRSGVINSFDKSIMLAKQIDALKQERSPSLALRLYNADPSISTDIFLSQKYTEKILEAAAIIADTIRSKNVYVLYSAEHFIVPNDILIKKLFRNIDVSFIPVKTQFYPQGSLQDIETLINRHVLKEQKKSSQKISLAIDASTALDVYHALVQNIPVIERIIHISGNSFVRDAIIKVKIGTPIEKILFELSGFIQKPAKIIVNGIIKGRAISNIKGPITKDTQSITVLSTKGFPDQTQSPCTHCGRCHQVCPVQLQPEKLFHHYFLKSSISKIELKSTSLCTECSLCNMICPSRLPLCQTISLLKEEL